ncbi:hypothetical protein [Garicola koreensis]|uniref:Transmembrane protein n=1 Tax=Garicola koreensis TaxID=1262554 RepID=A0A7W5TSI1_9MICC|nr:hypothetical protein [Garicola koreensis]MBB3666568.1 hypothetical protein [Garicola koreensis]
MDLLRAWILAAVVYLPLNFVLSVTIGYSLYWLYILCPILAAVAASWYHAERGVGGWARHLLAVLPVPIVLNGYWSLLQQIPSTAEQWGDFAMALAQAGILAAVGLGLVMLTRLLLGEQGE